MYKAALAFSMWVVFGIPAAWGFEFTAWDQLVKTYVAPKTIDGISVHAVDYRKLAQDPAYHTLLRELELLSIPDFPTKEEKIAFWINVYNIMMTKMVLDYYPLTSIKDIGGLALSVWDRKVGYVGNIIRTLHEIEYDILLPMGDLRVLAALSCATVSCPDLRLEAYTPEKVNDQLNDQLSGFLANPHKGFRLDQDQTTVHVSRIFKWFKGDFQSQGGVIPFLTPFLPDSVQSLLNEKDFQILYLEYNWKLNEL